MKDTVGGLWSSLCVAKFTDESTKERGLHNCEALQMNKVPDQNITNEQDALEDCIIVHIINE